MSDSPQPELPLAAIRHDGRVDVDALLARVVERQHQAGRRVRGLLMTYPDVQAGCAGPMVLVDIATGDAYRVSQDLGTGSQACRADTQGFATASAVLRRALDESPDLVVCNRFGSLEAEGGGFVDELLALIAHGVPLLTAVAERYLDAWHRFSGGATVLAADEAEVDAWVERWLGRATHAVPSA